MKHIYLLQIKEPPTEFNGCLTCELRDSGHWCIPTGKVLPYNDDNKVPEWCPLIKIEVPE